MLWALIFSAIVITMTSDKPIVQETPRSLKDMILGPAKTIERKEFMVSRDQKFEALKQSIEITKEYARSGAESQPAETVLKAVYKTLIQIVDEIEETADM